MGKASYHRVVGRISLTRKAVLRRVYQEADGKMGLGVKRFAGGGSRRRQGEPLGYDAHMIPVDREKEGRKIGRC